MICYIGLGSNLGDSLQYLQNAVDALQKHPSINITAVSSVYQSKPQGPQDQPDYLNAVIAINTELSADGLLLATQNIENQNQRLRNGQRWGARTLDLDILLYGDHVINQQNLTIPHPWICQRSFVLYPLHDIVSTLKFPNGQTLQSCIDNCPQDDLSKTSLELLYQ